MKVNLLLEDGSVFSGLSNNFKKDCLCEFVFNTSMVGYTEIITNPAYVGQAVVMTYPLIGSYGVCKQDFESDKPQVKALIVNTVSDVASNFRNEISIESVLEQSDIPLIFGIDTRAFVRLLREKGVLRGCITTKNENIDFSFKADQYEFKQREFNIDKLKKIAVIDYGIKNTVLNNFSDYHVKTFSSAADISEILEFNPNGIVFSDGAGNPKTFQIDNVKALLEKNLPVFAYGLGHLLVAIVHGFDCKKMDKPHHGANYPVRFNSPQESQNLMNGNVIITAQTHNYVLDKIDDNVAKICYENVNDKSIEGIYYPKSNMYTTQFEPVCAKSPQDMSWIYNEFKNKVN